MGIATSPQRPPRKTHRSHRPEACQATLIFLRIGPSGMTPARFSTCEVVMGKGNNKRGNKEAKKPKQEKPKQLATANFGASKPISLGEKKGK
ncbi:hypothetical protein FHY55_09790 [Oceanicola sp. D3]|uniref:hypothetical protein n=1 Tax=Oceanicola sp. D3 TaxID=2587163 RepID=UPI0011209D89|nr:hypothetical protein [Oceanicola sp. D3]QDC09518.1 hypothetical protein FHY55_09790 [Oceanicola sp. D3]